MTMAALTLEQKKRLWLEHFQPASGSGGKLPWRVIYLPKPDARANNCEITNSAGNIRRFKSFETAARLALKWNDARATVTKRNSCGYTVVEPTP